MNETFKKHILAKNDAALIDYTKLGTGAMLSIPTPDHYIPLLYTLGLRDEKDQASIFNDKMVAGSLNMTSVSFSHQLLNGDVPVIGGSDSTQVDSMTLK